jgi:hypothetical protein
MNISRRFVYNLPQKVYRKHFSLMAQQCVHVRPIIQAPDLHRAVKGCAEQLVSAAAKSQARDNVPMPVEPLQGPAYVGMKRSGRGVPFITETGLQHNLHSDGLHTPGCTRVP